jgi:hypothetical protein
LGGLQGPIGAKNWEDFKQQPRHSFLSSEKKGKKTKENDRLRYLKKENLTILPEDLIVMIM